MLIIMLIIIILITGVQGNFCIYELPEEDTSSLSSKIAIVDETPADDTQAPADDKEGEPSKVNNQLKLSAGLPPYNPIEVKVLVYIVRVCL